MTSNPQAFLARIRDLASRADGRRPTELTRAARVARKRRAEIRHWLAPTGLTPLAPLGFANTLGAIRDHYFLDMDQNVPWPEQELQRDLRRLALLAGAGTSGKHRTAVFVTGGHETRRILACIESLLSWPDSSGVQIVIADSEPSVDSLRIATAVPSVDLLLGPVDDPWWLRAGLTARAHQCEQLCVVSGKLLVLPGWRDALTFQLDRPDVGLVGARLIGWSAVTKRVRHTGHAATTHDVASVAQSWGMRTDVSALFDGTPFDPLEEGSVGELCGLVRSGKMRVLNASDCIVLAQSNRETHELTALERNVNPAGHVHARQRRMVVAANIPRPDVNSGSEDIYWLVRHMADLGVEITFVTLGERAEDEYVWSLRRLGVRVVFVESAIAPNALIATVASAGALIAINGTEFAALLQTTRQRAGSRSPLVYLPLDLRNPIESVQEATDFVGDLGQRFFDENNADQMAAIRAADLAGVISIAELDYLRSQEATINAFLLPILRSDPDRTRTGELTQPTVVFVGGFKHPPNPISVSWFISEVWPLVFDAVPNAQLRIYGSDLAEELGAHWAGTHGVQVIGRYLNAADPYRDADVVVAPLLVGGGVKGKVVTALGHGVPVVGTTVAADGLPQDVADCIRIADNARDMATAVCELLTDESKSQARRVASVRAYDRHYSESAGRRQVRDLMQLVDEFSQEESPARDS